MFIIVISHIFDHLAARSTINEIQCVDFLEGFRTFKNILKKNYNILEHFFYNILEHPRFFFNILEYSRTTKNLI